MEANVSRPTQIVRSREKAEEPKRERVDFRTTRANKELIERGAAVLGRSVSDFAVSTLVDAASRVIREHEILTLTARDQMMLAQALLAAKAGASFISPFVGRLDDIGQNGMELIADICAIYRQYPETIKTEVLVASVRNPNHVIDAAKLGAHVATLPPQLLRQLVQHPLTDKGLAAFLADWRRTGQSILEARAAE